MWTFAGLCVIAYVIAYWLRLIWRSLQSMGAVHEAALNRAATNRGDRPISDDIDQRTIF